MHKNALKRGHDIPMQTSSNITAFTALQKVISSISIEIRN